MPEFVFTLHRLRKALSPERVALDEITLAFLMPGVVRLPHGWGHDVEETRLRVAKEHAGVNTNVLTDNQAYDRASGTAVLFGTPVTVEPVAGS